jgi:hypothetical protein
MIEEMNPNFTIKQSEIQNGDIICFQKASNMKYVFTNIYFEILNIKQNFFNIFLGSGNILKVFVSLKFLSSMNYYQLLLSR